VARPHDARDGNPDVDAEWGEAALETRQDGHPG
jgi:hypothetical protein